jgi:hypothetical protein
MGIQRSQTSSFAELTVIVENPGLSVLVESPYTIQNGFISVSIGYRVEVLCGGSSSLIWEPPSGVIIKKISDTPINLYQEHDPGSDVQILVFQSFSSSDNGLYTCSIENTTVNTSVYISSGEYAV